MGFWRKLRDYLKDGELDLGLLGWRWKNDDRQKTRQSKINLGFYTYDHRKVKDRESKAVAHNRKGSLHLDKLRSFDFDNTYRVNALKKPRDYRFSLGFVSWDRRTRGAQKDYNFKIDLGFYKYHRNKVTDMKTGMAKDRRVGSMRTKFRSFDFDNTYDVDASKKPRDYNISLGLVSWERKTRGDQENYDFGINLGLYKYHRSKVTDLKTGMAKERRVGSMHPDRLANFDFDNFSRVGADKKYVTHKKKLARGEFLLGAYEWDYDVQTSYGILENAEKWHRKTNILNGGYRREKDMVVKNSEVDYKQTDTKILWTWNRTRKSDPPEVGSLVHLTPADEEAFIIDSAEKRFHAQRYFNDLQDFAEKQEHFHRMKYAGWQKLHDNIPLSNLNPYNGYRNRKHQQRRKELKETTTFVKAMTEKLNQYSSTTPYQVTQSDILGIVQKLHGTYKPQLAQDRNWSRVPVGLKGLAGAALIAAAAPAYMPTAVPAVFFGAVALGAYKIYKSTSQSRDNKDKYNERKEKLDLMRHNAIYVSQMGFDQACDAYVQDSNIPGHVSPTAEKTIRNNMARHRYTP